MNLELSEAERERAFKFCTNNLSGCWSNLSKSDLLVQKLR